jgi:hypothetical protein
MSRILILAFGYLFSKNNKKIKMNKRKKNKKIKKTKEKGYLRTKEKCVSQFNIIRGDNL